MLRNPDAKWSGNRENDPNGVMQDEDIELVSTAMNECCFGGECFAAWTRIKKALVEEKFTPTNKQSTPLCEGCQRNADNSCRVETKCVYFIPMKYKKLPFAHLLKHGVS